VHYHVGHLGEPGPQFGLYGMSYRVASLDSSVRSYQEVKVHGHLVLRTARPHRVTLDHAVDAGDGGCHFGDRQPCGITQCASDTS
jgi:hypothetical protein